MNRIQAIKQHTPCQNIRIRAQTNLNQLELLEFVVFLANPVSHMHIQVFHPSQALPTSAHVRSECYIKNRMFFNKLEQMI